MTSETRLKILFVVCIDKVTSDELLKRKYAYYKQNNKYYAQETIHNHFQRKKILIE